MNTGGEMTRIPGTDSATAPAESALLSVRSITKDFEGVRALNEVGFDVRAGDIKALIGPNGAGKTTLLNIINGLLRPNGGRVHFLGEELTGMKTNEISLLGISRTFQLIRLFSVNKATVLDNVMIGGHKSIQPTITGSLFFRSGMKRKEKALKDKAMEALRFVGLEHTADMQPGVLSFGNQRLVELARSLMSEPKLLLLDEPASGLNDSEVESFMELLSVIKKKGITILLVEHNMKLVMAVSDDVVVLNFGQWLAEGPPAAISVNPKVIEAYLGAEFARGQGTGPC